MKKKYWLTLGNEKQSGRAPLRTFKELAEEFGVSVRSLCGHMAADGSAPKKVWAHKSASVQNAWFDAVAMRKWWKTKQKAE